MSDNKKYYYIKLKDNYFDQDNIKILEAMDNGYIYSLIILKLYLKSSKHNGRLMMTATIPYDPKKLSILANVIGHDVAHIKDALSYAKELDLIAILDTGEIWMTDIQNFIGKSSTEADRIREYRHQFSGKPALPEPSVQMYDKSTPELERERKKEIEIEREKDKPPLPLSTTQNMADTVENLITYWNAKAETSEIPRYRFTSLNMKNLKEITRIVGAYGFEECTASIDAYVQILSDRKKYKPFPVYGDLEGFIRGGVVQYSEESNPWMRCAIDQTRDPRKVFVSKIYDEEEDE